MNPICRDCDVPMEAGFQIDQGHSTLTQAKWAAGDPKKPGFLVTSEATNTQRKEALRIITFRCPKCGLLDSYAWSKDLPQ